MRNFLEVYKRDELKDVCLRLADLCRRISREVGQLNLPTVSSGCSVYSTENLLNFRLNYPNQVYNFIHIESVQSFDSFINPDEFYDPKINQAK